ncbi:MAG: beta strand repeat-containing protein, partial [Archangium sp.]
MRLTARLALLASFVFIGCNDTSTPPASLEVAPSSLTLDVGESRTVSVSVKQGDKTTPASGATWSTSDANVVTVSGNANGTATVQGIGAGTATLTAKASDLSASIAVTVSSSATLTRIEVTPANAELAAGTTGQLTATGIFSDGTTRNITTTVMWDSSNEPVLTVSASGLVTAIAAGSATVTATLAGVTGTLNVTVTSAALESIVVTPTLPSIAAGTTQQFVATGTFADGSTQDLSDQVTWMSSATAVATVDDEGLARGVTAGTALISAAFNGVSGGTTLTVTAATLTSIDVGPTSLSLAKGRTQQLTATGHFSDGSMQDLSAQASWSSDTPTVLAVSATGEVTAVLPGTSTVTATSGSISGTLSVTVTAAALVSLEVTPAMPSVAAGQTQQFAATGTYSDSTTQTLTDQVTWLSSVTTVATVSNAAGSRGLVTTATAGSTVIGASLGTITGGTTLTVTNATLTQLQVTPANPTLPLGVKQTFTATGIFSDGTQQNLTTTVTWATDAASIATISNATGSNGELTPVAVGTTAVRATQGTITGNTNVTVTAATLSRIDVTPTAPSLAKGRTQQLTATGVYSDNTTQDLSATVSWVSATTSIATVSSSGLVTAVDTGTAVVTAQLGTVSGTTTVTVTSAVLTAIEITPATVNVPRGLTQQLVATGRYSDNSTAPITTQVTWSSATPANATVSNAAGSKGLVTGVAVGPSLISAVLDGVTGTLTVNTVAATLQSIAVTPTNPSIAKGRTQQFTATGTFSDTTTQNLTTSVTWTSATTSRVSISNAAGSQGLATAVDVGSSVVTATLNGVTGTSTMTVTSAVLTSIAVTPATRSIAKGLTQQYVATGTYSDATSSIITSSVTWSSGTPATATISNASGSNGLATALAEGTSVITATSGGVTGTANLTVTAASLLSIAVTPVNPSIAAGRTQQFTATGTYSDTSTQNITSTVTWTSSATARATISNAAGSQGLATAATVGSTTITATSGAVTGTTTLNVTAAVLESISIAPTTVSVVAGATTQLTATGHYSDGSQLDLTTGVTWSSDATARATVSNAAGSQGRVTGVSAGTANVSATQGTVTAARLVTVTAAPATLVSIAVTPASPSIALGRTQQFTATGTYSDTTTSDLTSSVTWSSGTTAVAT